MKDVCFSIVVAFAFIIALTGLITEEFLHMDSQVVIICVITVFLIIMISMVFYLVLSSKPKEECIISNESTDSSTEASMRPVRSEDMDDKYIDYCYTTANQIVGYVKRVMKDKDLFDTIKDINGLGVLDTDMFNRYNSRVVFIILHDLWKCYVGTGHKVSDESSAANMCYSLAVYKMTNGEEFPRELFILKDSMPPLQNSGCGMMDFMSKLGVHGFEGPMSFLMENVLDFLGRDSGKYRKFLYDVSLCMNSTNPMTQKARAYLDQLKAKSREVEQETPKEVGHEKPREVKEDMKDGKEIIEDNHDAHGIESLDELVGLKKVKSEVRKLSSFVQIQQWRSKEGLKSPVISYHCVFTGNPGTGKTTVARIIAEIYKELGILKKGHLVETDRSGLVGEYVGHTAVKTNKIIDKALDGVLFIDEAYSLVTEGTGEYGLEAISTLLKRMEDDRDRLVVIIAGYNEEMGKFIDSNPGLKSRFNRNFHFEDYSAEELWFILEKMVSKHDYVIEEDAALIIQDVLNCAVANSYKGFGNARYVRNIFEKILENQAMRLASEGNSDKKSLQMITISDLCDLPTYG